LVEKESPHVAGGNCGVNPHAIYGDSRPISFARLQTRESRMGLVEHNPRFSGFEVASDVSARKSLLYVTIIRLSTTNLVRIKAQIILVESRASRE